MALTNNPTQTRTIEKAWFREINRRWGEFESRIISEFVRINAPIASALLVNADNEVGMNAVQLRSYMAYLNAQIESLLLGREAPLNWQNQYQLESYMRGLDKTRKSLIAQGASLEPTAFELSEAQGISSFTARPSLVTSMSTFAPIHQEGLEFLYTRSYESLKGWTDNLSKEIRQISFDAVRNGSGVTETSKLIRERTGVSKSRAQLIARTEINQSYTESAIAESNRASEELGEEVKSRWFTAQDTRVRHSHATLHGKIMTGEEVRRNKSKSPWNCRCSVIPVIEGVNDTEAQQNKFNDQRKELLKSEARNNKK